MSIKSTIIETLTTKYPYLGELKATATAGKLIVLFKSFETGVVVLGNVDYDIGYSSCCWKEIDFYRLPSGIRITLENE